MSEARENNFEEASDEDLAGIAKGGVVGAFEVIVRRHQAGLLRYLMRRMRDRGEAEDVLQEAFARAYERLGQHRAGARLRPWLYAIARNAAVDHHRRMRLVSELPEDAAGHEGEPALDGIEARGRLWETARRLLSEDQYEALWLYYVEDLKTAEVARVMGRSWVSVKALLVRGRRRLAPHAARLYGLDSQAGALPAGGGI